MTGNRLTLHTEIKILRKLTISEDLIDSKENQQNLLTEIKNPKKQKIIEVKEIKLRPNIDEHDYQVKMRNVQKFLDEGDKVKVTMRFRGREMAHQELGVNVLNRVRDDTEDVAKIEAFPKLEGRQMIMVIAPK